MGDEETKTKNPSSSGHEGNVIGDNKVEEDEEELNRIELGPMCSIKDQLEKDKDDESLRKWKEQLLGNVDVTSVEGAEVLEPEVKIASLTIVSPGREELVLPIPEKGDPQPNGGHWFTLKEGVPYVLHFSFTVGNNIVSGLRYINNVWKKGLKVDSSREMLGTYSPQQETYTYKTPEETTPSGFFARGTYSAKTKFVDDDNKCYLEINYTFDIQKEWPSTHLPN